MLAVGDHSGVIDYRHDELVLTARAGTPLVELRRILASQQQMLAFDPPTFGGDGSLGGAIATGLSGPGRPWYGATRDAVLGVTLINGRAERLTFGGQVMKNVAGYDVSRLMTGAFGTLGVLLDISVKVLPRPHHEATRVFAVDRDTALANVTAWARTPLPLSATCHVDGVLHVRLSGTEKGVRAAAAQIGGDDMPHSAEFWDSLRDQTHPFFGVGAAIAWRCRRRRRIRQFPATGSPSGQASQRWFRTDATREQVDLAVRRLGGHATEFRDPQAPQPFDKGALKYYRRLKDAFDPKAILNRGRLFQEIGQEAVAEANP